ncbi:copper resistance protein B [bacterium]|nr:copper resistance protein B [bacterium]
MQRIKTYLLASCFSLTLAVPALAEDMAGMNAKGFKMEHGGETFHMFRLETDTGVSRGDSVSSWDLDGWIGTDENKLWIKSEGEHKDGKLEEAELWAMYSRNISTFWDAQAGLRYDFEPRGTGYFVAGFTGLAPYYFETEAHLFVSEHGDVTGRLREENDILITQKLILQPYAEVNLSAQDVPEQDIGAGIADGKIGLQTRYEFTKKFAPYIDVHYGRKFGETASIAESDGEDKDELVGAIGLRLMF